MTDARIPTTGFCLGDHRAQVMACGAARHSWCSRVAMSHQSNQGLNFAVVLDTLYDVNCEGAMGHVATSNYYWYVPLFLYGCHYFYFWRRTQCACDECVWYVSINVVFVSYDHRS